MSQRQGTETEAQRRRAGVAQQHLSAYLQAELSHSLGAYRVAANDLRQLVEGIDEDEATGFEGELRNLAREAARYNEQLAFERHAARESSRHPVPDDRHLGLTRAARFQLPPVSGTSGPSSDVWEQQDGGTTIMSFYDAAIAALDGSQSGSAEAETAELFAAHLTMRRDGQSRHWPSPEQRRRQQRHRLDRYTERRRFAWSAIPTKPKRKFATPKDLTSELRQIRIGNLSTDYSRSLYAVRALAEAHICMHAVEALQALPLKAHADDVADRDVQRWLLAELDRCIALNTFAYCAGRSAPWLFAQDAEEGRRVFEDLQRAWHNVVPTRCMWIAEQMCLLALHRRAYARSLKADQPVRRTEAYNDYHKLQRLIRDATRRVESAPIHVDGALEFLEALDAQAHHHIGELYRAEHAQKPAVKHFRTASYRLDQLKERTEQEQQSNTDERTGMSDVLTDSRWLVELQLSQGKAHYEMGHHKESLCWYLRAWRAFLQLLAADTRTEAGTKDLDEAIDWLTAVRFEPELRKAELYERVEPVVAQMDRIAVARRLGVLAADVLLRLGHLLFVLNIGLNEQPPPPEADPPEDASDEVLEAAAHDARQRVARTLGFRCLRKAAECDPHSTLVGADLLKARYRLRSWFRRDLPPAYVEALRTELDEQMANVEHHWPGRGDDYEQVVRVTEYLMLKAHPYATVEDTPATTTQQEQENRTVANELLLNFFMHTDSINVRKSQVHRYLMQPRVCEKPEVGRPAIEFVCMRRYSSAFPLLPRPSAFRALGGGYFVRLHASRGPRRREPFGIVVDPGPDFVENLYRTGFSLNDVDMIVVTHDHVDHLGSLDSLLSLLYTHAEVHRHERRAIDKMKISLVLNDSVIERYRGVRTLDPDRCISLHAFLPGESGARLAGFPEEFELTSMWSMFVDGTGHLDLSGRPSYGLCFSVKRGGASLAIAGDTPRPRATGREQWLEAWKPALEADVLVVHLSTVPLTELRQLAGLDAMEDSSAEDLWDIGVDRLAEESGVVEGVVKALEAPNRNLKGQLEFALWLRSQRPPRGRTRHNPPASLLGPVAPGSWLPWQGHAYLSGTLDWARTYRETREAIGKEDGLLVIGELSEELGTMRGKIAKRLNDTVMSPAADRDPEDDRFYALTSDIGLQAFAGRNLFGRGKASSRVRCTTCHLDMDRVRGEQLHRPQEIDEVCVKGENEGIFYNCEEHTSYLSEQPIFLEQLERFDVFGR